MAELRYKKLVKQYRPDLPPALDRLDLSIRDGEFVALLGPSGCGKSTTLRMTAGLESISEGQIVIAGKVVNSLHPKDRGIGLAFENPSLYPPLTIRDNLSFNLRARGLKESEIDRRVEEIGKSLHLEELLELKPAALSRDQKQRVNLGRALIRRPAVLLLDEPLNHLDAALRVAMRTEIKRLHVDQRFTTVMVTHDQVEAMALADRIAVFNDGKLQQFDIPFRVFNHPANEFVAGFLGEPPMNIFAVNAGFDRRFLVPGTDFSLPISDYAGRLLGKRTAVRLGVRPSGIRVAQTPSQASVAGRVTVVENLGDETRVGVRFGDLLLMASTEMTRVYQPGSNVFLTFEDEDLNLFDQDTGERLSL